MATVLWNTQNGLGRVTTDLLSAGYETPRPAAVAWKDGGADAPDEIIIVQATGEVPAISPATGFTDPVGSVAEIVLDPATVTPSLYPRGIVLAAIEIGDCNEDGRVGLYVLETTGPIACADSDCDRLVLPYAKKETGLVLPSGFNERVPGECAVLGRFRIVQYRVGVGPVLERREWVDEDAWSSIADGIEDLQLQYSVGSPPEFADDPDTPRIDDPSTWVHAVRVTVTGTSRRENLVGSRATSSGNRLQKTISTIVSLRNQTDRSSF